MTSLITLTYSGILQAIMRKYVIATQLGVIPLPKNSHDSKNDTQPY
jgi:hypothetical protein